MDLRNKKNTMFFRMKMWKLSDLAIIRCSLLTDFMRLCLVFVSFLFYFRLVSDLLINSQREEVKFLIWKIHTHRISKRIKSKVRSCVSFSSNFSSSGKYTGGTIVIRLSVLMSFSQQRSTWSVSRNSWDEKWF